MNSIDLTEQGYFFYWQHLTREMHARVLSSLSLCNFDIFENIVRCVINSQISSK
jgi:hypothetical protein